MCTLHMFLLSFCYVVYSLVSHKKGIRISDKNTARPTAVTEDLSIYKKSFFTSSLSPVVVSLPKREQKQAAYGLIYLIYSGFTT